MPSQKKQAQIRRKDTTLNLIFFLEVWLIYNVVLVPCVHKVHIYTYICIDICMLDICTQVYTKYIYIHIYMYRHMYVRHIYIFSDSFPLCECAQSCLTLCYPTDCSPPGSSVHGIFQLRILECVAISSPRGSS